MSAEYEKVGPDLRCCMTESVMNFIGFDLIPGSGVETENMDVVEGHVAITSTNDDELAVDEIGGMITAANWDLAAAFHLLPFEARDVRDVEEMYVVQSSNTIATAENNQLALIVIACMSPTRARRCAKHFRLGPAQRDCVENVQVVEVVWPVTTSKDKETLVEHGRRVCASSRRDVTGYLGLGPTHSLGIKAPQVTETALVVTAAKQPEYLIRETGGVSSEAALGHSAMNRHFGPVHGRGWCWFDVGSRWELGQVTVC